MKPLNENIKTNHEDRIINMLLIFIFIATFITKTIKKPFLINLSPADIAWPFIVVIFFVEFFKDPVFRKFVLKSKRVWLVIGLFFVGLLSSLNGYLSLKPYDLSQSEYLESLIFANMKSILVIGYFLAGILMQSRIKDRLFVTVGFLASVIFASIGLVSKVSGIPQWGLGSNRVISTVNDPNVAGLVFLIGILFTWRLYYEDTGTNRFKPLFLGLSLGLLVLVLILTGSRTGLLGLVIILGIFAISHLKSIQNWMIFLIVLLLMSPILNKIDQVFFEGEVYWHTANRVFNGTEVAHDFRSDLRTAAYFMAKDHMLTGVGPNQFVNFSTPYYENMGYDVESDHYVNIVLPKVPHNTYVTYFAERGGIGGLFFVSLLLYSFKKHTSPIQRSFLILVALYASFFNIENLRLLWFLWGTLPLLAYDKKVKSHILYKGRLSIILPLVLLVSIVLFIQTLLELERPIALITDNSWVQVEAKNRGLDLILELTGSMDTPLFISFDGEKESREYIVRNQYGLYKDHFDLPEGLYTMSLASGNGQIKLKTGIIDNGYEIRQLYHKLLGLKLTSKKIQYIDSANLSRNNIVSDQKRIFNYTDYKKSNGIYLNRAKGVNFENQITLKSLELKKTGMPNEYEMIFDFTKKGSINNSYILLARGYDLRDSRNGQAENLAEDIVFDLDLTKLEIGESFQATWSFNTKGRPYMLMYSFYHKNPKTEVVTRLYPLWIYDGYVQ